MKVAKAKGRLRGKQPKLKPNQAKHLLELARLRDLHHLLWRRQLLLATFQWLTGMPSVPQAALSGRPIGGEH